MRNRLVELIGNDFIKQNYFLTADLGFSVVERLKRISSLFNFIDSPQAK